MSLRAGATKNRLAGGATRGLMGGPSQRTGGRGNTTKKFTNTRGGTTSQSRNDEDEDMRINSQNVRINVKPLPLIKTVEEERKEQAAIGGSKATSSQKVDSQPDGGDKKAQTSSQAKIAAEKKKDDSKAEGKDQTSMSMQSGGFNSSLMETSEDEEAKKKEQAREERQRKKGLSEAELSALVDVELCETETLTLIHIPSILVPHDAEENGPYALVQQDNKAYEDLMSSKQYRADNYATRGSQTNNLGQKPREVTQKGFEMKPQYVQVNNFDIFDAASQKIPTDAERMESEYLQSIETTLADKFKHPQCFVDAESLASNVTVKVEPQQVQKSSNTNAHNKSGNSSSKSGGKSSKMKGSSASHLKESVNKSQTSDNNSRTSMSQTGTNQLSSETAAGDFGKVKKVEYVDEELPDSMMFAIRIIERLLTQSKFHEQHVQYKNYPQVDKSSLGRSEEEEEEGNGKIGGFFKKKADKKEEEEEKKEEHETLKDGDITLKELFIFECDLTQDRAVTCIDINDRNQDLIAAGYGEFDIGCMKDSDLKNGYLCFWTLKNPTYPEKVIKTEHSITCCQFSKKDPSLIAVGDSHGNIAIYNVRSNDTKPMAESKDHDGKHSDIVWEIQWVQREGKGEFLISISGDGRIIEWSMKKGLEFTELKQLKRETNPNQKDVYAGAETGQKSGGITFINTGGLSIDFPQDGGSHNNYFTATEDCTIHKCSTSYSEQYLFNYYGHTGPIYRVRCNPFWDSQECPIFLSCSYDWTVRVWDANDSKARAICHDIDSLKHQVNDICWAPKTSSAFASVANDGRIEIWDLYENPLKPKKEWFDLDANGEKIQIPKTVVRFNDSISPVLFTGNAKGQIGVYRSYGLEHVQVSEEDQRKRLLNAITRDDFVETKDAKKADGDE